MRRVSAVTALLGPMLISACGHSPEPTFLTLDYAAPASLGRSTLPPFRVGALHVPPMLDRPELARETEAGKVRIDDFARWSAPIDQLFRRTLTENLVARLPRGSVIDPETPSDAGAAIVDIDMLSLVERGGQLHLVVDWALVSPVPSARRIATSEIERRSLKLAAPLNGTTPTAVARAMSVLCGLLADDIASSAEGRN